MIIDEANKFKLEMMRQPIDGLMTVSVAQETLTDLLVLSVLGRMIGKRHDEKKQTLSFVFNEHTDNLQPEFDSCKFDKILYVSLLCVTILILVALLTLQLDNNNGVQEKKNDNRSSVFEPGQNSQKYLITPTNKVMPFGTQLNYRF